MMDMKKIDRLLIVIVSSLLTLVSCSEFEYSAPPIISERYTLATETEGTREVVSLHVQASNAAGGVNIAISGVAGAAEGLFVKNEDLESTLKLFIAMNGELSEIIRRFNYIDFMSDKNVVISYNDEGGKEFLIPDMLKEDGSLTKSLKYRKAFNTIHPRLSEMLARFLKIPAFGELMPVGALRYETNDKGYLIYVNKDAINFYLEFAGALSIDESTVALIRSVMAQYSAMEDVFEIGVYLKKID